MPTSSALQLADVALTWSNTLGSADFSIIDLDLASDRGLVTALLLSWFIDRRAADDDVPPSGDPQDRRGWWADQFASVKGDKIGSRMWLLDRGKNTRDELLKAKKYLEEASQWLLEDKVASSVVITVEPLAQPVGMLIGAMISRPGRDPVSFRFAHAWDHLPEDVT